MLPPIARVLLVLLQLGMTFLLSSLVVAPLLYFNLVFPPGTLMSDFTVGIGNRSLSLPLSFSLALATCVVLSIVLTVVLNLLSRFWK